MGGNTDGFDIAADDITIKNSVVKNQDDCVAINTGSNIYISGLTCSGSHGLSLSVGQSQTNPADNVVTNVTFIDSIVTDGRNGIHIKTHSDATTGSLTDVTYKNIKMSGKIKFLFQTFYTYI